MAAPDINHYLILVKKRALKSTISGIIMRKYKHFLKIEVTYSIRLISLIILASIILNACSKKVSPNTSTIIVYPSPPDSARIQYLTSISTSQNINSSKNSLSKFITGSEDVKAISKPYGIDMFGEKIFVCDLDRAGLEIINLKEKSFEYFIPKGLGQLQLPINCHVDSLGYLFVADSERRQVVIYDENLEYVNGLGGKPEDKPTDVFVKHGKIWVADVGGGRIDVYRNDSTYQFLYSIEGKKSDKSRLLQPTNIWVTDDALFVSDFGEFTIKSYDFNGNMIGKFGSYGRNIGQFVRPKGTAVDADGTIYVVDAAFENVQMFNKDGDILMFFGGPYQGPGDMYLPANISISYEGLEYFEDSVLEGYNLKYLILVTNNFGPDKVNVYGFIEQNTDK